MENVYMLLRSVVDFDFLLSRLSLFLPSIAIIATIAAIAGVYARKSLLSYGENLTSVEWLKENQTKLNLKYGIPMVNIWAPTAEELLFRAPLIICFGTLSPNAWYGIIISSAIFAAIHWKGDKINVIAEKLLSDPYGQNPTDDAVEMVARLRYEKRKQVLVRKSSHVFIAFWAGILFGYIGVHHQSLWLAVAAHAMWNLFVPILLIILMVLLFRLVDLGVALKEHLLNSQGNKKSQGGVFDHMNSS